MLKHYRIYRDSEVALVVKNLSANAGDIRCGFDPWVRKMPWRRAWQPTPVFLGFPGGSDGKNLPAMQETWVRFLSWEYPLEKGMATHSSILAWRIPGQRSLAGYSPWGHKEFYTTEWLRIHTPLYTYIHIYIYIYIYTPLYIYICIHIPFSYSLWLRIFP